MSNIDEYSSFRFNTPDKQVHPLLLWPAVRYVYRELIITHHTAGLLMRPVAATREPLSCF
jgi:hypothetical protein